jgi:phosphonate transport system substrate-binding protein
MIKQISLLLLLVSYALATEITFGIVPQQSPLKLAKKWNSITQYLEKETGIKIIFKTEKSIPLFEKKLYEGEYDLAYMNPYHFIVANKTQNYTAFIRAKKNITGILLAKEKEIDFSFENLKNKTFLFPAPNAFAATLLPKFEFKARYGFDIDKNARVIYVNSHDSVYKGISREIGYLGGGIIRTYNNFKDKNDKDNISIVYKTKPYPSHPFAYHPRVNKDDIFKIQQAFLSMPKELSKTLSIKEFKTTYNDEYDVIKNIGVK